jgi:NADH-quinone oxidoreductase subunit M
VLSFLTAFLPMDMLMPRLFAYALPVAVFCPLLVGCLLLFARLWGPAFSRGLAALGFVTPAVVALGLAWAYPSAALDPDGYAWGCSIPTGLEGLGIGLRLGLNGFALPFFVLAALVGLAAGLYALHSTAPQIPVYWVLLLWILGGLMGAFASTDLLFFYCFHEVALIPTFIATGLYGGSGRRLVALELTVYLSLGAIVALLGLILLYTQASITSFDLAELRRYFAVYALDPSTSRVVLALGLVGFGTLVSLFPFHTWAPRGYAAMPSSVVMLHAGVLKKFGLYALVQVIFTLAPLGLAVWTKVLVWLALGNILLVGLVTLAQRDLKLMISYSSVMHMGYPFLALACMAVPHLAPLGLAALGPLCLGHGLSVALLFLLAHVLHQRTHTYDMRALGGLGQKMPILAALFVFAIMASIGLPGLASFWGEWLLFTALYQVCPVLLTLAALGIIICAIYGLRAANGVFMGPLRLPQPLSQSGSLADITWPERLPALILAAALLLIGLCPQLAIAPGQCLKDAIAVAQPLPYTPPAAACPLQP